MNTHLVDQIARYCADAGMAETTFGRHAVNDGKFVARLRSGGRCWPETADKVRAFIDANPVASHRQSEGAAA